MGKKTNTILFILGGTVFNILITLASFLFFLFVYHKFIQPLFPDNNPSWAMPLVFTLSIFISFLVYRMMIKIIVKKVNMDKYFDPIFRFRKS